MGWFDPPAIRLRKLVPLELLSSFNGIEEFALMRLQAENEKHKPYQLGVVLALWIKAADIMGVVNLTQNNKQKVQAVYEASMNVLKQESYISFLLLIELSEAEHTFGIPPTFYRQISVMVL